MNPLTTASKLKTLRHLKGLSIEQVAEQAQLNLNDYKALEAGQTAVPVDKLEKACNALGINYKEWFEKEDSHVYVNHGEVKGGLGNNIDCENCYFYERNEEDTEMLQSLKILSKALANILDDELLARNIEKVLRSKKDKSDE